MYITPGSAKPISGCLLFFLWGVFLAKWGS